MIGEKVAIIDKFNGKWTWRCVINGAAISCSTADQNGNISGKFYKSATIAKRQCTKWFKKHMPEIEIKFKQIWNTNQD